MRGEIFSKKYKHGAHVDIEKSREIETRYSVTRGR